MEIKIIEMPEQFGGKTILARNTMFQDHEIYCGTIHLLVVYWTAINEIKLALIDDDDTDIGWYFKIKNEEEGRKVFHEFLNLLNDYHYAKVNPEIFWDNDNDNFWDNVLPELRPYRYS